MLLDDPEELGFFVPKKLANAESLVGFFGVQAKSSGNLDVASSKTAHCPYG